jgi:hypothetical protein
MTIDPQIILGVIAMIGATAAYFHVTLNAVRKDMDERMSTLDGEIRAVWKETQTKIGADQMEGRITKLIDDLRDDLRQDIEQNTDLVKQVLSCLAPRGSD